ncbi:MAG TPA: hypothetical protein VMU32_01995 [Solirubrobacteraceae bacterium]|nr:hypothetical protein [Solirubrobacteraceae bacterium]
MAYIFCESCGIGFHSNVYSCPECGRPAKHTLAIHGRPRRRSHREPPREDVESEVRQAIYGWRSGTVELRGDHAHTVPAAG